MAERNPDVLVIGAGVSGLSTALALLDAGLGVTIYAAHPPQRTTSAVAGALWGAHLVGADERIGQWAGVTLRHLRGLAGVPAAGVREMPGIAASLMAEAGEPEPPDFARDVGAMPCDPAMLPAGFAAGWRYTAPVVAMPVYLDYLADLFIGAGGELRIGRPLDSIASAARRFPARILVNCAGIGARELAGDAGLVPVRGQVVIVANPGLTSFFVGEHERPDEVTYYFPHGATVLLGGTQQEGNASTEPDQETAARILTQCAAVEPGLAGMPVIAHRVGLRPVRRSVRLEAAEIGDGQFVIHNYGHGGAGVTLSWGCAQAVRQEVTRLLG